MANELVAKATVFETDGPEENVNERQEGGGKRNLMIAGVCGVGVLVAVGIFLGVFFAVSGSDDSSSDSSGSGNGGGGGGSATVNIAVSAPNALNNIEKAQLVRSTSDSTDARRKALLKAIDVSQFGPNTDFALDPVETYLYDQIQESVDSVNDIVCRLSQTGMGYFARLDPADEADETFCYLAQVDSNVCDKEEDGGSGSDAQAQSQAQGQSSSGGSGSSSSDSSSQSTNSNVPNYTAWSVCITHDVSEQQFIGRVWFEVGEISVYDQYYYKKEVQRRLKEQGNLVPVGTESFTHSMHSVKPVQPKVNPSHINKAHKGVKDSTLRVSKHKKHQPDNKDHDSYYSSNITLYLYGKITVNYNNINADETNPLLSTTPAYVFSWALCTNTTNDTTCSQVGHIEISPPEDDDLYDIGISFYQGERYSYDYDYDGDVDQFTYSTGARAFVNSQNDTGVGVAVTQDLFFDYEDVWNSEMDYYDYIYTAGIIERAQYFAVDQSYVKKETVTKKTPFNDDGIVRPANESTTCLDRNALLQQGFEYRVYDANGERLRLNMGESIYIEIDGQRYWGYASTWGVYGPTDYDGNELFVNGTRVSVDNYDDGNGLAEVRTLLQYGGRMNKREVFRVPLSELENVPCWWWNNTDYMSYIVEWRTDQDSFVVTHVQDSYTYAMEELDEPYLFEITRENIPYGDLWLWADFGGFYVDVGEVTSAYTPVQYTYWYMDYVYRPCDTNSTDNSTDSYSYYYSYYDCYDIVNRTSNYTYYEYTYEVDFVAPTSQTLVEFEEYKEVSLGDQVPSPLVCFSSWNCYDASQFGNTSTYSFTYTNIPNGDPQNTVTFDDLPQYTYSTHAPNLMQGTRSVTVPLSSGWTWSDTPGYPSYVYMDLYEINDENTAILQCDSTPDYLNLCPQDADHSDFSVVYQWYTSQWSYDRLTILQRDDGTIVQYDREKTFKYTHGGGLSNSGKDYEGNSFTLYYYGYDLCCLPYACLDFDQNVVDCWSWDSVWHYVDDIFIPEGSLLVDLETDLEYVTKALVVEQTMLSVEVGLCDGLSVNRTIALPREDDFESPASDGFAPPDVSTLESLVEAGEVVVNCAENPNCNDLHSTATESKLV